MSDGAGGDGNTGPETGAVDLQHELGNASLLLDAALRILRDRHPIDDDACRLLDDVKRRIDDLAS